VPVIENNKLCVDKPSLEPRQLHVAGLQVNVEVVQRPVIFPSVTVCNKNHLDTLVVDKLHSVLFDGLDGTSSKVTDDVQQGDRRRTTR